MTGPAKFDKKTVSVQCNKYPEHRIFKLQSRENALKYVVTTFTNTWYCLKNFMQLNRLHQDFQFT